MAHPIRRILPLLLSAALLLSGCGIIVYSDPTGEDPAVTDDARGAAAPVTSASADFPDKATNRYAEYAKAYLAQVTKTGADLGGASVFLAAPRDTCLLPGGEATAYSAALAARNETVESALNIRLSVSVVDESAYADLVLQSVRADAYYSDLLMLPQKQIGSFATNGILMNLRSIPFLDLTLPYFDADSLAAATAGKASYAVAGAASFEETTLCAVFFNRGMMEEAGLELPYSQVYAGTWTWDSFFSYAASSVTTGVNGPSSYAYQYSKDMLPSAVFFSAGGRFTDSSAGSAPTVAYTREDAGLAAVVTRLFTNPLRHTDASSGVSAFHTGGSLFLLDRLYLMSWMPNSAVRWGILPFPKAEEKQSSYRSLVSDDALFFGTQINTLDTGKTSVLLRALNAASYGVLTEGYVDYAMNTLLRDNDSANMLEILAFSRTYDFAFSFGPMVSELAYATYTGFSNLSTGTPFENVFSWVDSANRRLAQRYG